LHVGHAPEGFYDCVITEECGAREKLMREWLCYSNGVFIGPWKITIGDAELWKSIEPIVQDVIESVSYDYPEDIWSFRYTC